MSRANDYIEPNGRRHTCWNCMCDCGQTITVRGGGLKRGKTKSCGCYKIELCKKKKKSNMFDTTGDFGIGYAGNTNNPFYFDLEDFEKIVKHYWSQNKNGYISAWVDGKKVAMHRYVMNVTDSNIFVDHVCHNNYDNRKEMLRPTSCQNNTMNEKVAINNSSGVTGISWEKSSSKWHAYIWYNGRTIHLGRHEDFNDAVNARRKAENEYFGEYSYYNSMNRSGSTLNQVYSKQN